MPIRVLMTKIPPRVTASMPSRYPGDPVSPPIVPASSVRIMAIQVSWIGSLPSSPRTTTMTRTTPTMISSETTKRPAMSAIVPRSMNRSKR